MNSHFAIEQEARFKSGRLFNFNGSSGIWRKECIIDSGGWQEDTLAEDLDLSYRAQLKGWKFIFIKEPLSEAELPVSMAAFKQQQRRWIKGTIQVACKILPQILRSRLPLRIKLEAALHLTNYFVYFFSLLASISILPALIFRRNTPLQSTIIIDIFLFVFLTLSVFIYHACAQIAGYRRNLWKEFFFIPLLISFSMGMSVSNSWAILDTLLKRKSIFHRTPKFGSVHIFTNFGIIRRKIIMRNPVAYFEIFLGIYFCYTLIFTIRSSLYQSLLFLVLFITGFFYVGILSFFDFQPNPRPFFT